VQRNEDTRDGSENGMETCAEADIFGKEAPTCEIQYATSASELEDISEMTCKWLQKMFKLALTID
jgi:hypothetical protein